MRFTLYYHPLASFCHKVLISLYDNAIPFTPVIVDLADETSQEAFRKIWPPLKFPVLVDAVSSETIAESASIILYLDAVAQPATRMATAKPWQATMWDRLFDDMLQLPMQKIVIDSLRPADVRDPHGVTEARENLVRAYAFFEQRTPETGFWLGPQFSLADCSAVPALFWSDTVNPLGDSYPKLKDYFNRLKQRPSVARVLREAEPYFHMFPLEPKPAI